MARVKLGLGFKLVISVVGSLIIIFGILTIYSMDQHTNNLQRTIIQSAMRVADTVDTTIKHNMLISRCSDAFELIYTIGELHGIEKIRIFDKEGNIGYSTDSGEISTLLDKDAEACYVCHSSEVPSVKIETDQRWRIFRDDTGDRVLGLINPIRNEPKCSTSTCHYHPVDRQILGVLDVQMSLKEVDSVLAGERNQTLLAYVITSLIMALISGSFVLVMVHRPVKRLIEGTHFAARGFLDHKLEIESKDEMGQLADSFNKMTTDLKKARDEITDWAKTLEVRVEEKTAELERAHENIMQVEKMASLGKLSAIVAHEINNPLTGVLTYSKLLQKRLVSKKEELKEGKEVNFEECGKYLKIIENEITRCGDIVKNLLMFSKKSTVHFTPNDFNELLLKSIKLISHQLELSSINLEQHLDPKLPQIVCDAGQLQQIFVALFVNAIEAMDKGGNIRVKTLWDFVNRKIVFSISDSGSGMDDDTLSHLYEPFYTTKEGTNGSGLGLTVVYGIAERHGARITVDSALNKGTTFTILFPLEPPNVEDDTMKTPVSVHPDRI